MTSPTRADALKALDELVAVLPADGITNGYIQTIRTALLQAKELERFGAIFRRINRLSEEYPCQFVSDNIFAASKEALAILDKMKGEDNGV